MGDVVIKPVMSEGEAQRAASMMNPTSDVEHTVRMCIGAIESGSSTAPVVEGLKSLAPALRALAAGVKGWRCFHCDVLFLDREAAERHFGTRLHDAPLCAADRHELVATRKERDEYGDVRAHVIGVNAKLREALKPFAEVGQWLHARPIPDDTPMVEFQGMNNYKIIVTRGHFKAASVALASAE